MCAQQNIERKMRENKNSLLSLANIWNYRSTEDCFAPHKTKLIRSIRRILPTGL